MLEWSKMMYQNTTVQYGALESVLYFNTYVLHITKQHQNIILWFLLTSHQLTSLALH